MDAVLNTTNLDFYIPEETRHRWQNMLDTLADALGVSSVLLLRSMPGGIEVQTASQSGEDLVVPAGREPVNYSAYIHYILENRIPLVLEDASTEPLWQKSIPVTQGFPAFAGFPVSLPGEGVFGVLAALNNHAHLFTITQRNLLYHASQALRSDILLIQMITDRRRQQELDEFTGVYNRYSFENDFNQEVKRANRYDQHFSMVLLDILHFNHIHLAHGHYYGDHVLKLVAERLVETLRDVDRIYYLGGAEFAILLPGINTPDLGAICQRLHETVEEGDFGEKGIQLEICLGAAQWQTGEVWPAFYSRVDEAIQIAHRRRDHTEIG